MSFIYTAASLPYHPSSDGSCFSALLLPAAVSQSIPIVTAYDTLGEEGLTHSLIQTGAQAIFLDPALLPKIVRPLKTAKDVRLVIYNSEDELKQEDLDRLKQEHPQLKIVSFDDLKQLGVDHPTGPTPPDPDDICCVMYTSGSTGAPKGVVLKHRHVIAASTCLP